MYIKWELIISEATLALPQESPEVFHFHDKYGISIAFRPLSAEAKFDPNILCIAEANFDPPSEIHLVFSDAWKRNRPVDLDKSVGSIKSFVEELTIEANRIADQAVRILRWRLNAPGGERTISGSKGNYYSFDRVTWKRITQPATSSMTIEIIPSISEENKIEIVSMIKNNMLAPLGHELYREAWPNRKNNTRSAFVIGVAAAEVGIKQCIVALAPDAAWLIEEGPSPLIDKILAHYLPKLLSARSLPEKSKNVPKSIRGVISRALKTRNTLVHAGAPAPTPAEVLELLTAVRNLLWLLDIYSGRGWAAQYLDAKLSQELDLVSEPRAGE